ncbi:hypothetical protein MMC31_007786 [Peltigera leucophlebia]|nr:hypothetical protein [Peltigera leucophlebia]
MSALSVLPAELLHNILQLGQVKEEGNTALSQALGPAEEHSPLFSSTSRLSQAKDEDSTAVPQDSNSAHDLLPVPPSPFQLSQAKDEGVTITSQDSNSTHELATGPLSIQQQQCQVTDKSFPALSQDFKLVQELALLPSSVTINWTWGSPTQNALSSDPPIHRLLLLLLANPNLAALVKHVSFSGRYPIRNQGAAPIQLKKRDMKAVQDMILETQLSMAPVWINALELGTINVFVALILSQLVNLQTLHLDADFFMDTKFLGLLFKHALLSNEGSARRVSTFSALSHVRFVPLHIMSEQVSIDREQVKGLFYLPNIEIIEAVVFQQRTFNWPTPIPPVASTLKILKLPLCRLDENALRRILSVTPNLEVLAYERDCDIDPPWGLGNDSAAYYDLDKLDLALAKVRATLRRLSLSVCFFAMSGLDFDEPDETFGIRNNPWPYQKYEKLEYLEISFVILFGYNQTCTPIQRMINLLPPSIRHLQLRDDMADYMNYEWNAGPSLERLRELIAGRDRLLPNLESITLRLRYSSASQWDESEQGELKSLCAGSGLACGIDKVVYIE